MSNLADAVRLIPSQVDFVDLSFQSLEEVQRVGFVLTKPSDPTSAPVSDEFFKFSSDESPERTRSILRTTSFYSKSSVSFKYAFSMINNTDSFDLCELFSYAALLAQKGDRGTIAGKVMDHKGKPWMVTIALDFLGTGQKAAVARSIEARFGREVRIVTRATEADYHGQRVVCS